ncbi:MAG: ABC transporter ATP-binding protein [Pseudomonadota bacterium]
MCSDIAIKVDNLSKCYQIYAQPRDRLKQAMFPRLLRLAGQPTRQYFREFWALNNVSFEIKKGQTVGIIGRNGSGKSTLLQMICGTLNPTSGSVETHGRVAALLELGSGFNPEFSGRDNVFMNAALLGLSRADTVARFDAIARFADIGEFIERPVKTYSSGMMVRLAFAVIAHVDADILVVDEALAVGDAFFTQKCMRFLREFMQTGTVLFVSHDTAAIKSLCSDAVWLDKGKVLEQGAPKQVCERYLQAFYEAQQPRAPAVASVPTGVGTPAAVPRVDQRQAFINASNLRNDLQVFVFDPQAASFGSGGARIVNVGLLDAEGRALGWVVGGEAVTLRITVLADTVLDAPIVGFHVKDRLGQALFGDNTYLSHASGAPVCQPNQYLQADFTFFMPILPGGDYSINAAVANGTQAEHVQHHWMHDAVLFKSESSSAATGLVGIPMVNIAMQTVTLPM